MGGRIPNYNKILTAENFMFSHKDVSPAVVGIDKNLRHIKLGGSAVGRGSSARTLQLPNNFRHVLLQ